MESKEGAQSSSDAEKQTPASASGAPVQQAQPVKAQSAATSTLSRPITTMRTGLEEGEEGISLSKLPRKRGGLPKRDRSTLRKGKWTYEEEEYTSRIIHYFSTGLLTLPEGSTLRSYLAEKLNCDPMRITKKYAGAACLGRRAYHYRERAQPTIAEIQLAKAQLDQLEHRFRMRVEEGYAGAPLPSPSELVFSPMANQQQPQMLMPNQAIPAATIQSWLLRLAAGAAPQGAVLPGTSAAAPPGVAPASWNLPQVTAAAAPVNAPQITQSQWLLPQVTPPPVPVVPQPQGLDFASLSRLALNSQAAQSALAPVLSQLIAAQCLQHPSPPPQPAPPAAVALKPPTGRDRIASYASQLRQAYELQTAAQQNTGTSPTTVPAVQQANNLVQTSTTATIRTGALSANIGQDAAPANSGNDPPKPRTAEDKAAGSILLGFLSSLRQSYLEAVRDNYTDEPSAQGTMPPHVTATKRDEEYVPATVTDSSQPLDSSVEDSDWNSDKKTDPSSSEDSDKEAPANPRKKRSAMPDSDRACIRRVSKGPPRKRLKAKKSHLCPQDLS